MAVSGVALAKISAILLNNDKVKKSVLWIVVAIFSPLILVIVTILALFSGGADSNVNTVEFCFNNATIQNVPAEYTTSITNMRQSFASLDSSISNVDMDTGSLDNLRIKAIFYVFFLENPQSVSAETFVSCFYTTTERTSTLYAPNDDGVLVPEVITYTVTEAETSLTTIFSNICSAFSVSMPENAMQNADLIYNNQLYGQVEELDDVAPLVSVNGFVEPVSNWITSVTSEFGMRYHPITSVYSMHNGIDLGKPQGTKIYSVLGGKVTVVAYDSAYGYYIKIDHGDGFETLYAHCSKTLVNVGQTVSAGQRIGLVGSTGSSTGNHLHFETIVNGTRVNPRNYLPLETTEE